jgi:hypothetical protein
MFMAKPIQATPTLYGSDAERLIEQINSITITLEEHKQRVLKAKERRDKMMMPKACNLNSDEK